MGKLGRQISRNSKAFGRALQGEYYRFGRQLKNSSSDVGKALNDAKRQISNIELALKPVPILGGVIKPVGSAIGMGLGLAQGLNSGVGNLGSGVQNLAGGNYGKATQDLTNSANDFIGAAGGVSFD